MATCMKHACTRVILLASLEVFMLAKKIALPQHIHFEGTGTTLLSRAHARPPKDASSAPAVARAASVSVSQLSCYRAQRAFVPNLQICNISMNAFFVAIRFL